MLIFSIIFSQLLPVHATETVDNEAELRRMHEIDSLIDERSEIIFDSEKNVGRLAEISRRLRELGLEEISFREVKQIMRASNRDSTSKIRPAVNLPYESGIIWESARYNYSYRGRVYEIQELKASPNAEYCSLTLRKKKDSCKPTLVDLITEVVKIIVPGLADKIPEVDGKLVAGITVAQILEAVHLYWKNVTVSDKVDTEYLTSLNNYCTLIFIKPHGASDGKQVLSYVGNKFDVKVEITVPTTEKRKVGFGVGSIHWTERADVSSQYYDNGRWNEACKNYYNYKENHRFFDPNVYLVRNYYLKMINGSLEPISIPFCYAPIQ